MEYLPPEDRNNEQEKIDVRIVFCVCVQIFSESLIWFQNIDFAEQWLSKFKILALFDGCHFQ